MKSINSISINFSLSISHLFSKIWVSIAKFLSVERFPINVIELNLFVFVKNTP